MQTNRKLVDGKIVGLTGKQMRRLAAIVCSTAAISLGSCLAQSAELTFDCKGADANTSLTMTFTDGKLMVTDSFGSISFPASLEGDLDQTYSISGAVTREMTMPVPDALDACISTRLATMGVKVSNKNAFGASRQQCATQLLPTGTKQPVDVTYSAVGTEPSSVDLLVHLQYKSPSKLTGEILYINLTPAQSCATKLVK